ncbi:hypothetical protein DSUL_120013 [Desulfovibrionales bacterium]
MPSQRAMLGGYGTNKYMAINSFEAGAGVDDGNISPSASLALYSFKKFFVYSLLYRRYKKTRSIVVIT